MLDYYGLVVFFMMVSGLVVFCSMRKHLLLTLLSLEFLVLVIYVMFMGFLFYYDLCYYFILVFLTFAVCEGAMGLSILVCVIRSHGNDSISSLSILGW
uniref:NADH-ubiquinone oxidoreductase chain 4L n=1 Tax=Tapeinus singularis TaxID=1524541 RepID=A0A343W8T5_9HEMI|nr:NADH dehydrogenase subunit 4L [Tapeinus singularis]AVZ00775.1 NADH dehydrogenase subunit 4L [Tapeinus singularis]